jgi:hypothetical protein
MSRETATLETLDRKMAELSSFLSPSEIFRALLEGTVVGAPRAAVFLVRDGRFKGWSSVGYPAHTAQAQRQTTAPLDSGWLSSLAAEEDVRWRTLAAGESAPDYGQPHAAQVVGLPVRVGGKAVAILVAERQATEDPWSPAALAILCQAARLRLELDLAWRRLKSHGGGTPSATSTGPKAPAERTSSTSEARLVPSSTAAAAATATVTEAASAAATEIAPWSGMAPGTADADPRREEARRYARLVATDIRLYNEEAVIVGRRERDLVRRLGEQLKRGRDSFSQRFPDLGPDGMKLLDDAYVQVLAGGDSSLI